MPSDDRKNVLEFNDLNKMEYVEITKTLLKKLLMDLYAVTLTQLPDNKKSKVIIDQLVTLNGLYESYFEEPRD